LILTEFKGKWYLVIGVPSTSDALEVLFGRSPSWHELAVDFDADGHLIHPQIHASISIIGIHTVLSKGLMDSNCGESPDSTG
jgi:hypothetical protein